MRTFQRNRMPVKTVLCSLMILGAGLFLTIETKALGSSELDRILDLMEERTGPHSLSVDWGGPGLWQRLLRLRTTASALYTTAHPDDEQGGMLTLLSRGMGVRTSMLTLNRGEGGANAIGSELFDGLGLVRTEEMLVSDRYYGLDDQYFTTLIDYGFSKTLDESLNSWGRENVLRDLVRVIRINRPLVLISRFYGGQRDGHGNHQTAGILTQEAFEAAGDPNRFPELSQEGLRPWQPLKLYRSNLRPRSFFGGSDAPPEQRWNVRLNVGQFSPWLGQSYQEFSGLGLSFQRSQTSGRRREGTGALFQFFERLHGRVESPEEETGFFDGIDTSISGIFRVLGETPPEGSIEALSAIQHHVEDAISAFNMTRPDSVVPFLILGLQETRRAIELAEGHADALLMLKIKEQQFQDAINTALGVHFRAVAIPASAQEAVSPFAPDPTMGVVVPGQRFSVSATLVNSSDLSIEAERVELGGPVDWQVRPAGGGAKALRSGDSMAVSFDVTTPPGATLSRRYFHRPSIQDTRYQIREAAYLHLSARKPALVATAHYRIGDQSVASHAVVYRREANLPYGYEMRELKIAPALGVTVHPENLIVPLASRRRAINFQVGLLNNKEGGISGQLTLETPQGWQVQPPQQSFEFAEAGERRNFTFSVSIPAVQADSYAIKAVATADSQKFEQGYDIIRHRDYDIQYLYRDSVAQVRGIDVKVARNLKKVGYVMGVGDQVPSGIEQLGAEVTLLSSEDLATGNLSQYDSIVVGTRAYAVRPDLITYNRRLLDYARQGGNLVILYQTQEFIPNKWAAYPAELPRGAEEVSEQDSPVKILATDHPAFNTPNKITLADFDGWVEQRGSKFFSQWDSNYVAMIETQDQGQEPQQGGWLTAKYGNGYYTYFAYAVHRQFPYGVPGPYRIFANVLSLGRR